MTRIVDLSFTIESSPQDIPEFMRIDVSYTDHAEGASELEKLTGAPRRLLRNAEGPAGERLSIGTHATTHVDAPWHYNSEIGGEPAQTIDELPLDWFFGPGVVVDVREKADGDPVTAAEMQAGIAAAGHALAPGDIVLDAHGARRVHQGARLHVPRAGRDGGRDAVALRGRRARDGHRRLGLGRPARRPGEGGHRTRRAGHLLGGAPVRPALFADRAADQPFGAAVHRLPGGVLPAEDPTCQRGPVRVVAILPGETP